MAGFKQLDPDLALSAAADLFWRQGYGATAPADLVDALGIGKGAVITGGRLRIMASSDD